MTKNKSRRIVNGVFKESYKERLGNIINSKIFSISADEVIDVSGVNYLSICVHYPNEESCPSAKLWSLIKLTTDCSADNIHKILEEQILKINTNKILLHL